MNPKIYYAFMISFAAGIFTRSFFEVFLPELVFILLLCSIVYSAFYFFKQNIKYYIIFPTIIILAFSLGVMRFAIFEQNNTGDFDTFIGKQVKQKMVIVDEPQRKGYHTKLILRLEDSDSKAIMWVPNYPEYTYGDLLLVSGYINNPKNFISPDSGKQFDYISYLKKDQIFYEIKPIKISYIQSEQGNIIKHYLFKIKHAFLSRIKSIIPSSEASLLGGLLLGAKEDMGKDLLDDFRITGVIHIVVLSGYNLTLVADFFMKIFAFFGLAFSSLFGSLAIVLFALMTGASATIIRASLMALLVIFARATGRTSETTRALFLAGFLMLLFNPMLLAYDPSFQLSFLATLGLLLLSPKIEEKLQFVPKKLVDIRGILAATLSTQFFVFPLILYMMGEISVISPVVNVLILIFVPFVMFFGLVFVLMSYISITLASAIAFLVYIFLAYDLFLVEFFAKMPIAVLKIDNFSAAHMFGVYALYIIFFLA